MNKFDIANGLIFRGLRISIDSLDDRIIAQKKVFLLQELGINLGYSYNWYIHGPYSPTLTSYLYDNLEFLQEYNFGDYACTNQVLNDINIVNDFGRNIPVGLNEVKWYELLASLLYLNRKDGIQIREELFDRLLKYKPQYTERQCELAFERLSERYIER